MAEVADDCASATAVCLKFILHPVINPGSPVIGLIPTLASIELLAVAAAWTFCEFVCIFFSRIDVVDFISIDCLTD